MVEVDNPHIRQERKLWMASTTITLVVTLDMLWLRINCRISII